MAQAIISLDRIADIILEDAIEGEQSSSAKVRAIKVNQVAIAIRYFEKLGIKVELMRDGDGNLYGVNVCQRTNKLVNVYDQT